MWFLCRSISQHPGASGLKQPGCHQNSSRSPGPRPTFAHCWPWRDQSLCRGHVGRHGPEAQRHWGKLPRWWRLLSGLAQLLVPMGCPIFCFRRGPSWLVVSSFRTHFLTFIGHHGSMVNRIDDWLVVWSMFIFPYIGNFIIPIDKLIFVRGVGQPPTRWIPSDLLTPDVCFHCPILHQKPASDSRLR